MSAMVASSLNPEAPLFIPAAFQQVEDFSPQWWDLVQSTAWFRDHWYHQHQQLDDMADSLIALEAEDAIEDDLSHGFAVEASQPQPPAALKTAGGASSSLPEREREREGGLAMAWEEEELEQEHEEDMEASEEEGEDVVVGQMPTFMVPKHINKRALKNKALSVSLDKKALKDFVTGFHKRKKKRRKEAQRITQEKDRRKRIEARKKRKQEKEIALYGKVVSSENADGEDGDGDGMDDDLSAPAPEIKTYEDGGTRITVVTSEITHGDDDDPKPVSRSYAKKSCGVVSAKKNPSLGVKKKPPPKRQFSKSKKTKKVDTSRRKNKGKH